MWFMKRYLTVLSTFIERKFLWDITYVFFAYVIFYCKISLWHMWSFSDRKTYFAVYAPRILCFFIEGNPVWLFWCVKEKNFWNHYDQMEKLEKKLLKSLLRETYRRFRSLLLCFFIEGNSCDYSDVLVFVYEYRENISSPMALFFVSLLKENLSNKKGKNGKKREKSHFHVFSIKQRCVAEFLVYFFPFSLFPPKK